MRKAAHDRDFRLTPDQQQIVDDGLRILARMIARRVQHDAVGGKQTETERSEDH